MTVQDAIETLQHMPVKDRIQIIEILLQSLKNDLADMETPQEPQKPFQVRTFDLGGDITLDREELYLSRGL